MRISFICQDRFLRSIPLCQGRTGRHSFAPFAALTGFEGAIKETARVTGEKIELDETQKTFLDEKLKVLLREKTPALFTYFQKDEQKVGELI